MAVGMNNLLDPSVCTCFPGSYRHPICNKIKWSTLSICSALLIIVVYLTSGLYALIDVTSMISIKAHHDDDILWPIGSSSMMILMAWTAVTIYCIVVLLIMLLICGIQLRKPWILFFWSILMIFMVLADGVITIITLREYQQQNYRSAKQIKILFFVMSIRLIIAISGIFVTIFHFRRLRKAQSEYRNRQRMLVRYHSDSSTPSLHDTWARSGAFPNLSKDNTNNRFVPDLPPSVALPRAKIATVQQHPALSVFHSFTKQSEYLTETHQRALNRGQNNDFRYNIPLHERFNQPITHDVPEF